MNPPGEKGILVHRREAERPIVERSEDMVTRCSDDTASRTDSHAVQRTERGGECRCSREIGAIGPSGGNPPACFSTASELTISALMCVLKARSSMSRFIRPIPSTGCRSSPTIAGHACGSRTPNTCRWRGTRLEHRRRGGPAWRRQRWLSACKRLSQPSGSPLLQVRSDPRSQGGDAKHPLTDGGYRYVWNWTDGSRLITHLAQLHVSLRSLFRHIAERRRDSTSSRMALAIPRSALSPQRIAIYYIVPTSLLC